MFLSKRNGTYYLWFTNAEGKRQKVSTRCGIKSDALKFLQSFDATERKKRTDRSEIQLGKFVADYLTYVAGTLAPNSVASCRLSLKNLQGFLGDVRLSAITPQHCDYYKTHRLKTVSPASVNIELRTIRAAMNVAVRWDMLAENPFAKVKFVRIEDATPVYFSREDFQKFIDTIKEGWLRELVVFATLTGLRRGEMVNLRWSEVSFKQKHVVIQSSEGFKTKNGKRRIVPLNATALYLLRSKAQKRVGDYVFTLNDKPIFANWITHKFKEYIRLCGFKEGKLHFHSLRHTFATWLVQSGESIYKVQKLLGHSSTKVTEKYSHIAGDDLHAAVDKIDDIILN